MIAEGYSYLWAEFLLLNSKVNVFIVTISLFIQAHSLHELLLLQHNYSCMAVKNTECKALWGKP